MIYFDNASTSLPKDPIILSKIQTLLSDYNCGNPSRGTYTPALNSYSIIEETRSLTAQFFGLKQEQIYLNNTCGVAFVANATTGLNLLLQSALPANCHVITSGYEHNSVLRPLALLKQQKNISFSKIPLTESGKLNYRQLSELIKSNTYAIIINHASNLLGTITDLEILRKTANEHNLFLFVDAAQTAGLLPINMTEQGIDALVFAGHKNLGAIMGVGGICINNPNLPLQPVFVGGTGNATFNPLPPSPMPYYFEYGTPNIPAIYSLKLVLEQLLTPQKTNPKLSQKEDSKNAYLWQINPGIWLVDYFYQEASKIDGINFYGQFKLSEHVNCCAFNLSDYAADEVATHLYDTNQICCRSGFHCAPDIHKYFHTENKGMVRFSFNKHNTQTEVDIAIQTLQNML